MWDGNSRLASTNLIRRHAWHGEPILGLGVYLSGSPWRLGPAWAVLAGALAGQAPISSGSYLLRLGGSILLADAVWGILWRRTASRQVVLTKGQRGLVLPYLASQSPLTKVQTGLAYDATEDGEAAWRDTLVGLGLAILLSVLLGTPAVLLSLLAILASVGIRHRVRHGKRPAFMTALLGTGLPWALGAALGWTGDALPPAEHSGAGLLLGAGFTCLTWFVYRVDVDDSRGDLGQIWVGQAVVLVILIVLREAVGLAMVGSLLAVSFLWMSQRQYSREEVLETLNNCDPWWLACMLASALAVRF